MLFSQQKRKRKNIWYTAPPTKSRAILFRWPFGSFSRSIKKHFWRFNKKKAENNFNISIDFTRRFFYSLSCLIFCSKLHKGEKLNAELRQWWLRDMRSIFSSLLCENLWLASQHFSPRIRHISCLHVCFTCAEHKRALKHFIFVGRFGEKAQEKWIMTRFNWIQLNMLCLFFDDVSWEES